MPSMTPVFSKGHVTVAPPPADSELIPIPELDTWRTHPRPKDRVEAARANAEDLRLGMLAGPQVRYMRSFGLIRVPYPTRYAFLNACRVPTPLLHIVNRLFVVQYDTSEGLKTILVSPSDTEGNQQTPFFNRLAKRMGPFGSIGRHLLAPQIATVEHCLAQTGITPEQVDYITYDHLHTQDLRRWLGDSQGNRGVFPNAKLLVMEEEWQSVLGLAAPQRDWYCPQGVDGIPDPRIIRLDSSTMLGDGIALVRTPGHTQGNHSIATHTPEGVMVTSENGVGPDSYAPHASAIPGLKAYAEASGMEVILNGNTLEAGLEQYASMVLEKTLAGPSVRDPRFPNILSSSELTSYWAFPGIKPTFSFGEIHFGQPLTTRGRS